MGYFPLLFILCYFVMGTCSSDPDVAGAGCEEQNHALTGVITVLAVKIARMEAEIQEKDDIIEKMREDQKRNTCPQEEGAGENVVEYY